MRSFRLAIVALALAACEPLSSSREGRDDAVRYQLPARVIAILERADSMELFALGDLERDGEPATGERFAGRPVIGRTSVQDPHDSSAVARALYRAVHHGSGQMLCFAPHHGVRARRGSDVIELAICYSCLQMKIVGDDGPNVPIAPWELMHAIDSRLERAGLRFDWADETAPHGRWVSLEP